MSKREFTRGFKVEAVRQVEEGGKSVASMARDLGSSGNLLHRWQQDLSGEDTNAFPGKDRLGPENQELLRL